MERDNKKARDEARKDYNETIRVIIFDLFYFKKISILARSN